MDIFLIIIAGVCMLIGLIGCVVPALPGPALGYAGMLLIHFSNKIEFTTRDLVIAGVVTVAIILLDYIFPAWCTKKFGGSKLGIIGSIVGLFVGVFLSPLPLGFLWGPFVGAVVGELIAGKDNMESLKSGMGSFVGFILSSGLKLAVVIAFCALYCKEVWNAYIV
ncbi:MAG: DUF456 domain-containing protein [Paludibacteraceae bacterium]|nr:DUF456 domain-containing protein [Paludibacteraceae bacterium]